MFLLTFIKNLKKHLKILETSPRIDLSNNTTFSQAKSHETVPLSFKKDGDKGLCYVQECWEMGREAVLSELYGCSTVCTSSGNRFN